MDVFGFAFATAFLVAVFTMFAILGRLMDIVAAGIGSTVAPTMVSGFRAWTPPAGGHRGPEEDRPEDDGPDGRETATGTDAGRRSDPGLVVPVTRLSGRGERWLQAGEASLAW
jgi:hypothetical protein